MDSLNLLTQGNAGVVKVQCSERGVVKDQCSEASCGSAASEALATQCWGPPHVQLFV
jgi:hypothetical protein